MQKNKKENGGKIMTVEITKVTIEQETITIDALAIEDILMAEDPFEDVEVPQVRYAFDRSAQSHMKYLFKVCQSQKRCQREKCMGGKLEKLEGVITNLSETFRVPII